MLDLERVGDGRLIAPHALAGAPGAVFGGQLLAQMVVAAGYGLEGKPLTSFHSVFSRPVRVDSPIQIDLELIQAGRNAASVMVTVHQDGPPCVRGVALGLVPQQPEQARHTGAAPDVPRPADANPVRSRLDELELRIAGGVDLDETRGGAPAELFVWARATNLPDVPNTAKAMVAFVSESYFVGAALRPHEGLSQADAFQQFAPAVVSHGLAFHDTVVESEWWLFAFYVPHLAGGRLFGRGDVFSEDGRLVASVWQENLMRPLSTESP